MIPLAKSAQLIPLKTEKSTQPDPPNHTVDSFERKKTPKLASFMVFSINVKTFRKKIKTAKKRNKRNKN